MDVKVALYDRFHTPISNGTFRRNMHKHTPKRCSFINVALKPADNIAEVTHATIVRKDNWCDDIAINYLSQNVQDTTGLKNSKSGYDSLVEVASAVSKNFNVNQQQELVIQSLEKAFPSPITSLLKTLLPNTKFAREYYVVFTTLFFTWLIGPCEVKESEFNGRKEKNVVHIKKCRFLEESNCVGMCVNLCKIPSQTFIKDSLGMPLDMVPNFDDMSCEMIFGQDPPAPAHDPALKQPCYTLCKSRQSHAMKKNCSS